MLFRKDILTASKVEPYTSQLEVNNIAWTFSHTQQRLYISEFLFNFVSLRYEYGNMNIYEYTWERGWGHRTKKKL